jgi:hypothetical protein
MSKADNVPRDLAIFFPHGIAFHEFKAKNEHLFWPPPLAIRFPDERVPHEFIPNPIEVENLCKSCEIPESRQSDLREFLIFVRFRYADYRSNTQLTRKQLVSRLKKQLAAAKELAQGLDGKLVRAMQNFECDMMWRQKYGAREIWADEGLAFIHDRGMSHKKVVYDVAGVSRRIERIEGTIKWLETAPETDAEQQRKIGSARPIQKVLATSVFAFWTTCLRREARITKSLVAFADHVYRTVGYKKTASTLAKQLDDARKAVPR